MLRLVRTFTELTRRRDRLAVAASLLFGACGLAMALPGGRAYNEKPAPTFFRPEAEETRKATVVIVCAARVRKRIAAPPPSPPRPRLAHAAPPWAPGPAPVVPSSRVRGPPRA